MIMGAQSDASRGGQSGRPKCEECAISGGCLKWCVWGCPKWCGYPRQPQSVGLSRFAPSRQLWAQLGSKRTIVIWPDFVFLRIGPSSIFNILGTSWLLPVGHCGSWGEEWRGKSAANSADAWGKRADERCWMSVFCWFLHRLPSN